MTRPAVIIGLGGTGQWVTTYVKKELLEDNGGNWPSNVRLLCFDTWSDQTGNDKTTHADGVASLGNTRLDLNTEFIPLSDDTINMAKRVINDQAPHIGKRISELDNAYSWFDAGYFMNHVPQATWRLNVGTGAIRQFGRLAFFNHATVIQAHLSNALNAVRPRGVASIPAYSYDVEPHADAVQILIIASLAGGTGAGMFLDMAVMARQLATQIFGTNGAFIHGIFVLPGTFQNHNPHSANEMKARAYAAWRELARFMNLGPVFGMHKVMYDDHTSVDVISKPFDQVFLVDSDRSRNAFTNVRPENGVFPSIGNFISTTLDNVAGLDLGAAVNAISGVHAGRLGFSTFGAYSVQLPISHAVREYALQLERDMLQRWLVPQFGTLDGKPAVTGLQSNQNAEKPDKVGDKEVQYFMTSPKHDLFAMVNRSDQNLPCIRAEYQNSPFLAKMYTFYEKYIIGVERGQVDQDARGSFCPLGMNQQIEPDSWLGTMLLPGDFARTPIRLNDGQIKAELASTIRSEVRTSKEIGEDPTPEEVNRIITEVEGPNGYIVRHHGGIQGGHGSFEKELDSLVEFHSLRFRQILYVELMNILNGTSYHVITGFLGRLGYVEAFLKKQREIFDWYISQHLVEVKTARAQAGIINQGQSILKGSRDEMIDWAGKKQMVYFNHPRAFSSQEDYLDNAQNLCEVLKDDKVIIAADKIATACKQAVTKAERQVANWKKVLVVGPDSLYAQILDHYEQVAADLDYQAAANQAQSLKKLRNYPADYTQSPEVIGRIDNQLEKIRWMISSEGDFTINCEVNLDGRFIQLVQNNDRQGHNLSILAELGRAAWMGLGSQQSILEQLGTPGSANYIPGDRLGDLLIEYSDPMYLGTAKGMGVKSALRQASNIATPGFDLAAYLAAIDAQANQFNPPLAGPNYYYKSNSSNPHKISMLQWVNLLAPNDFAVYADLLKSYRILIQGGDSNETASRLHIFPAEANAAFYEHHFPVWLNQPVREFSPRVVSLLSEVEKVRWFFQCYAFGFIVHGSFKPGQTGLWWRLVIPGEGGQDICFYRTSDMAEPDPFVLISQFCKGVDVVNSQPVVWKRTNSESNLIDVQTAISKTLSRLNANKAEIRSWIVAQVTSKKGVLPVNSYQTDQAINQEQNQRLINYFEEHKHDLYNEYVTSHPYTQSTNPGWSWVTAEDYADLATLGRMMYIETLLVTGMFKLDELNFLSS